MKKYIEIINDKTKEVHLRSDVTGKSDRYIDRVISGMSINLNHSEFSIITREYETEQPKIK